MNAPMLPKTSRSGAPCGTGGGAHSATNGCACGGAGCEVCRGQGYVRPHFFAGQLLTEDDLQALTDYVASKDRLHNRYLIGAGVVCGLEVTCHPCGGGTVIVHSGYALDCCGNDIVLQCATELDINAMVRDLRRNLLGGYDCGDPCANQQLPKKKDSANAGAADSDRKEESVEEPSRHYCLYVRYCEEWADPVTPYATDEPCGQAVCEWSRVREGLKFELRCQVGQPAPNDFIHRLIKCFGDLTGGERLATTMTQLTAAGGATADNLAYAKEALLDQFDRSPHMVDCALRGFVKSVALPTPGNVDVGAANKLIEAYVRYLRDCFCAAINPPCLPCDDPGVLLACLEVKDCDVIDICNLERTFVLSAPAFRYWVPIYLLGEALERFCCKEIHFAAAKVEGEQPRDVGPRGEAMAARGMASTGAVASATGDDSVVARTPKKRLDLAKLWLGRLGMSALDTADISLEDAHRLSSILAALGDIAGQGAFDNIFPVSQIVRESPPQRWPGDVAAVSIRENEAIRESVNAVVADHMHKSFEEMRAGSERQIVAEVDRQVKAAIPADKLDEVTAHAKELEKLKADYGDLSAKYTDLVAKINRLTKGTQK